MKIVKSELEKLHGLYMCGMSLNKVAERSNNKFNRKTLHYYFKAFGFKTRPLKKQTDFIIHNGSKYTQDKNGYYRKTISHEKNCFLHRDIWIENNGPIPDGYNVVFKDRNKKNFDISNLCLMSVSDVVKKYGIFKNQYTKDRKERVVVKLKPCLNCNEIIPYVKGIGPAAYNKKLYCNQKCHSEHQKKQGRTIGDIRREYLEAELYMVSLIAHIIHYNKKY